MTDIAQRAEASALAERMKQEIRELIDEGTIPPAVAAFSELHEHVDANTLGGTGGMAERMKQSDFLAVCNEAIGRVDSWLRDGRPGA